MKTPELVKFANIITLNDYSEKTIRYAVNTLIAHMEQTNRDYQMSTEYFSVRLKDSEKSPFAKDLLFEWASLSFKDEGGAVE
jgi:hypothetical protein